MATLLADSPDETASQPPPAAANGSAPPAPEAPQAPAGPPCTGCGAELAPGQEWCLQCGTAVRGARAGAGWRGLTTIAAATVLLVLGAAAAGYAALSKHQRRAPAPTTTVAQAAPPPAAVPPVTTPQTFSTPTPTPPALTKPPRIPLKAVTPAVTVPSTPTTTPTPTPKAGGEGGSPGNGGSSAGGENQPEPLLLDTDAASTYNPYDYPAQDFGDPSLASDGDSSTGWTAQVNPATAPKLAEGLLIDLKSAQKLSSAKVVTTTPGLTLQVYGSTAATPAGSITDPAWVPLDHAVTIRKRHAKLKLDKPKRAFRFVVLWISAAPASAVGTPQVPGHVSVNELELFPPS